MIGDDLRGVIDPDAALGRVLRRAEWVKAPFPVYPWMKETDPVEIQAGRLFAMNWENDRIPERLVPTDADASVTIDRLAFQDMGIFHQGEPGAVLATEFWARDDAEAVRLMQRMMGVVPRENLYPTVSLIDGFLQCHLIGFSEEAQAVGMANVQVFRYLIMRHGGVPRADAYAPRYILPVFMPVFDAACPEDIVRKAVYVILTESFETTSLAGGVAPPAPLTQAQFEGLLARYGGLQAVRAEIQLDTTHVAVTVATVAALLNARNLPREVVTPTQSRPSRRRGEPPPFRYHILKVDPALARAGSHHEGHGEPVALHLRRGHWKIYTPQSPLLGRHVGRWWWGAHLSGQADRLVDKDYEVGERPDE